MAKVTAIVSQTLAVDNSDDTSHTMDVKAQVTVGNGRILALNSGVVNDGEGHRVTFQSNSGTGNMRIEFNNATDRQAVVESIDSFVADIEANVNNLKLTEE